MSVYRWTTFDIEPLGLCSRGNIVLAYVV